MIHTYSSLVFFLENTMKMREDYQPWIIRQLLRSPGRRASIAALARVYDAGRMKKLPPAPRLRSACLRVLASKHQIITALANEELKLNADLSPKECEAVQAACTAKILAFNSRDALESTRHGRMRLDGPSVR